MTQEEKDRVEFDLLTQERIYKSRITGLANKYSKRLGLELDGLEDICEYLDDRSKRAVKERIIRARRIIEEITQEELSK